MLNIKVFDLERSRDVGFVGYDIYCVKAFSECAVDKY